METRKYAEEQSCGDEFQSNLRGMETMKVFSILKRDYVFQSNLRGMETTPYMIFK